MKRFIARALIGSAVTVLVLGGASVLPAGADGSGAQKAPLLSPIPAVCFGGATTSEGFAVINTAGPTASPEVTAVISVKGGVPDATYFVELATLTSCAGSPVAFGELTTNDQGNGTTQISGPGGEGIYHVFGATCCFAFFVSPGVTLT